MKFSRIDLADCTTPESLLVEMHKLQGGVFPIPIPIHEWALALDITSIKALETNGFEGGLVMFPDRSEGTILVNEDASHRRRRFTIGHELGHFLLPWHKPRDGQAFLCSAKDMAMFRPRGGGDRYAEMEAQANRFSAGVLMPAVSVRADLRARRHFEVAHIFELADRYDVSKEAMTRRCVDLHDDTIAVVLSQMGCVKRIYAGKEFPRLSLRVGHALPTSSAARRAMLAPGQSSAWDESPAEDWLEGSRGTVSEQSIGQKDGFRTTLLAFEPAEEDDDDQAEEAWAPLRFGRR